MSDEQTTDEDLLECTHCGETNADNDDFHINIEHRDLFAEDICDDCYAEVVFACDYCGDDTVEREGYIINEYSGAQVCERDYYDHYFYCEGCDHVYSNNNYGDGDYCRDCAYEEDDDYRSHENIMSYQHTQANIFTDNKGNTDPQDGVYYLGIEIELEDSRDVVNDNIMMFPLLQAKEDSSLSDGCEVVSQPGTIEAWNEGLVIDWGKWQTMIHQQLPDQSRYRTNGVHIHVSRTAFQNKKGMVSGAHLYKFMQLLQNNEPAYQELAGRKNSSYCEWRTVDDYISRLRDAKDKHSGARSRPINLCPTQTVELRFFDGRSDPVFLKRALQLVHASVEYTRTASSRKTPTFARFILYVNEHRHLYPQLDLCLKESGTALLEMTADFATNIKEERERELQVRKEQQAARAEADRLAQEVRTQRFDDIVSHSRSHMACECDWCIIAERHANA